MSSLLALEKCVVRIDHSSNPKDFRSGWFFSTQGYILSAGHDLTAKKEGDKFSVSLLSGEWEGEAILIEIGKLDDYAIFKVESGLPSVAEIIPVLIKEFEVLGNVACVGPLAAIEGRVVTVEGDLRRSRPGQSGRPLLQFSTSELDRKGMSGAPIVRCPDPLRWVGGLKCPMHKWEAVGIQSCQTKQTTSRTIALAQPIPEIYATSDRFRKIVSEQQEQDSFRRWPISLIEGNFWGTPSQRDPGQRVIFVIREWNGSSQSEEIWNLLQDELVGAKENLSNEIGNLPWLHQEANVPGHDLIDGKIQPTEPLHVHLDDRTQIAVEKVPLVRMTVDLTAQVNGMTLDPVQRDGISHAVAVVYPRPVDAWKAPPPLGAGVDALLHLKERSPQDCASALQTIVHDVLLDVAIFHGIRILPAFFSGAEGARAFSDAKVRFIEKFTLRPYGLPFPSGSSHYQSLAACARPDLTSPISQFSLTMLWHHFVSDHLLPSVARDSHGNTIPVSFEFVIQKLSSFAPKLSFSKARAFKRMKKLESIGGGLCALAVISKLSRQASKAYRSALGELFGYGRARKGLVNAFRFDSFKKLFAFRANVTLILYRAP